MSIKEVLVKENFGKKFVEKEGSTTIYEVKEKFNSQVYCLKDNRGKDVEDHIILFYLLQAEFEEVTQDALDEIEKEQYKNLRKNFNNLVKSILGKRYLNYSSDVYSSDIKCCEEIEWVYKSLNKDLKIYKKVTTTLIITLLIVSILLFVIANMY